MKTLKYLTICFLACCLFSGNLLAQAPETVCADRGTEGCGVGLAVEITGIIVGTAPGTDPSRVGREADVVFVGDSISYSVEISLPSINTCPTDFILADVIFPDSTPFPLNGGNQIDLCVPGAGVGPDPGNDPNASLYIETGIGPYVVRAIDKGNFQCSEPVPPSAIRACVDGDGVSRRATRDDLADVAAEYTTSVIDPCVEVTKTPYCVRDGVVIEGPAYSKVGDDIIWHFEIENCGDDPLEFVEINDELLEGLLPAIDCGSLADPLLPGEICDFNSLGYTVTLADENPIVNDVNVVYNVLVPSDFGGFERVVISQQGEPEEYLTVVDDDTSTVGLVDPALSATVTCIGILETSPGVFEGGFAVTFCNDGDVELVDVTPEVLVPLSGAVWDPSLTPFDLDTVDGNDPNCKSFLVLVPVDDVCGAGSATLTVDAEAFLPDDLCLENVIELTDAPATDTCSQPSNPCWNAEKRCDMDGPVTIDDPFADYVIDVNNCGDVDLSVTIIDSAATGLPTMPVTVPAGQLISYPVSIPVDVETLCEGEGRTVLNSATVSAECLDGTDQGSVEVTATCDVDWPPPPSVEFTKECSSATELTAGVFSTDLITINNCGEATLSYDVNDLQAPYVNGTYGPQAPGGDPIEIEVELTVPDCLETGVVYELENTVIVTAIGTDLDPNVVSAVCEYECGGGEGCTPGFWKNHPKCWCGFYNGNVVDDPNYLVSDLFTRLKTDPYDTVDNPEGRKKRKSNFDEDTMLEALAYQGGGELDGAARNLLRHATAAVLNACNGNVSYEKTETWIIDEVNAKLDAQIIDDIIKLQGDLAGWNEDGCPINARCQLTPDDPD